jgi:cytosine/adenosine deaminase-related metal-dependent hydrolase
MSPMQAIEAVTRVPAEACGISQIVGTLEPGKNADIVVVQGNPLDDVGNLANVEVVFRDGVQVVSPGRQVLFPVASARPAGIEEMTGSRDDWLATHPGTFQ